MQLRPPIQIQSILKAMTDVVLPAIDPDNKLAQEQVRLIMGTLTLMSQQIPMQFRFDCDELARLIEFSHELRRLAKGGSETQSAAHALDDVTAAASGALDRAKATPEEIERYVLGLRSATGSVVTQVYRDGDASSQDRVQKAVLAMSREQLLRDRSWLMSQGWEPDAKLVPAIETLLA